MRRAATLTKLRKNANVPAPFSFSKGRFTVVETANANTSSESLESTLRRCDVAMCLGLALFAAYLFLAKTGPDGFFPSVIAWNRSDSLWLTLLLAGAFVGVPTAFGGAFIATASAPTERLAQKISPLIVAMAIFVIGNLPPALIGVSVGLCLLLAGHFLLRHKNVA